MACEHKWSTIGEWVVVGVSQCVRCGKIADRLDFKAQQRETLRSQLQASLKEGEEI